MSAIYLPGSASYILPPPPSIDPLFSTDDYVQDTGLLYHATTDRLMTVGHPYFDVYKSDSNSGGNGAAQPPEIPKVSAHQYRVFRVKLPDPNAMLLPDSSLQSSDFKLVWQLKALSVVRGQPCAVGLSGNSNFNKMYDRENSPQGAEDKNGNQKDHRVPLCVEGKQSQILICGCKPSLGEYWGSASECPLNKNSNKEDSSPAIQLYSTPIEDGDMHDMGFGNMDFSQLSHNKANIPFELLDETAKYPDWVKMNSDPFGDTCFFMVKRESLYARHYFEHAGKSTEPLPKGYNLNKNGDNGSNGTTKADNKTYNWFPGVSGSLTSSENNIFNKPYWLTQAQGHNNCICWNQELFVTVLDTTRNSILNISIKPKSESNGYDETKFNNYLRHVEEYDLRFVFRLCKVPLTPQVLFHLHGCDPHILQNWGYHTTPQPVGALGDVYRFNDSNKAICPVQHVQEDELPDDPYHELHFWDVNVHESFTTDLHRFPLGRSYISVFGAPKPALLSSKGKGKANSNAAAAAARKRRKR